METKKAGGLCLDAGLEDEDASCLLICIFSLS